MQPWIVVRRMGWVLAGGLLLVGGVLTIAALMPRKWGSSATVTDCRFRIYVSGGAMHTNLFVPVETPVFDWRPHLDLNQVGKSPAADYRYLQFGWGDRIFYTETPSWDQMNYGSALRALFAPGNTSALMLKGHATVPRYPQETLKGVCLQEADYLALMQFLQGAFETDDRGKPIRLGAGQDGDSSFYAAHGYYSVLRTCNSWTAEALRAANVNTPVWGGLAPAVMYHLKDDCDCEGK